MKDMRHALNGRFGSIGERIGALLLAQERRDRVLNSIEQHKRRHVRNESIPKDSRGPANREL